MIASTRGLGRWSRAAIDGVGVEGAAAAVDVHTRSCACRRQGSRLAWCSTAVVTTTSSWVSPSRKASWFIASVVLRGNSVVCVAGSAPTKRVTMPRASSYRALVYRRLDAGAAVDAGVERQEVLDRAHDRGRGGRRRSRVQVDELAGPAVRSGHPQVVAHEATAREGRGQIHACSIDAGAYSFNTPPRKASAPPRRGGVPQGG